MNLQSNPLLSTAEQGVRMSVRRSWKSMLKWHLVVVMCCCLGAIGPVTDRFGPVMPFPVLWLLFFGGAGLFACFTAMVSYLCAADMVVVLLSDRIELRRRWRPRVWWFDQVSGLGKLELNMMSTFYELNFNYFPVRATGPAGEGVSSRDSAAKTARISLHYVRNDESKRLLTELNRALQEWHTAQRHAAFEKRAENRGIHQA